MYFLLSVWSVFKERIYMDFFRDLETFVECFETTNVVVVQQRYYDII